MIYPDDFINKVILGDCIEVMKEIPDNSIDTVITNPPYGLSNHSEQLIRTTLLKWLNGEDDYIPKIKGFMNKSWDAFVPPPAVWKEIFRVMKPGATILVFAGTRTYDLMTISMRLAGFEIKDTLMFLYGQGFPKAMDISKQIDKMEGAEREVISKGRSGKTAIWSQKGGMGDYDITTPATPEAKLWNGWKSHGLKPAYEPIIMAMKPNEGSYAENALRWGVAGLNIDGGRIPTNEKWTKRDYKGHTNLSSYLIDKDYYKESHPQGRFPANLILDEETAKMLDRQSGISGSTRFSKGAIRHHSFWNSTEGKGIQCEAPDNYGDIGGASRFFHCAKASKNERNMGLEGMPLKKAGGMQGRNNGSFDGKITYNQNNHPTVKSLRLLEYLCILTKTPNGGIVLDPFAGSGTTCMAAKKVGRDFIGIEKEPEYVSIARARLNAIKEPK